MKRKTGSGSRNWRRYSVILGAISVAAAGFAAAPARADMVVQQTTSYTNPPAVAVETPAPSVLLQTPAPRVVVEAPAPTVTYTYSTPPATYVERSETVTVAPRPPVTRNVPVDVLQDTPKYDYTVHRRVQTAQVQTRTAQRQTKAVQHKVVPRCQCQPSQ